MSVFACLLVGVLVAHVRAASLAAPLVRAAAAYNVSDGSVSAVVTSAGGITALTWLHARNPPVPVSGDGWEVSVAITGSVHPVDTGVAFAWACPGTLGLGYRVVVVYTARDGLITKGIQVAGLSPASFTVETVTVFTAVSLAGADTPVTAVNPYRKSAAVASFFRLPAAAPTPSSWLLCVANPFASHAVADNGTLTASYAPSVAFSAWPGDEDTPYHAADVGVIGVSTLSKYYLPSGVNTAERDAFAAAVDTFLLDSAARAAHGQVRVNVAWDENDYQLDVNTAGGVAEYKRIIDRNAAWGISHVVFEPSNSAVSSRANHTDAWGWEASLMMTLGERIRTGAFVPGRDALPATVASMLQYAGSKGLKLMAYAYPILAFSNSSEWLVYNSGAKRVYASLASKRFQNYLIETYSNFVNATGAGGFAWDYTFLTSDPNHSEYAQWAGWMRVLRHLRERFPDIVMDHRQLNHQYGAWYQLAGSYAEPIAGDENPESYGASPPSLHVDHVAADHLRVINAGYRNGQLLPMRRIPGFWTHQTERSYPNGTLALSDLYTRDTDLLGIRYSLLSNLASAGMNLVACMLPARDEEEFALFPPSTVSFITSWLAWADANQPLLSVVAPLANLAPPSAAGNVDGAGGVVGDRGVVFLFNPLLPSADATLVLDESISGLGNSSAGSWWFVQQVTQPAAGVGFGVWQHGSSHTLPLDGSSATVLLLTRLASTDTAMRLCGIAGDVALTGGTLNITNATGPAGSTVLASVYGVASAPDVNAVIVNGVSVPHFAVAAGGPTGVVVTANVTFSGDAVRHSMRVGTAVPPPSFTGGSFATGSFSVPAALAAQLTARQAEYPVNWTATEQLVPWLAPARLRAYIQFVPVPAGANVTATVDGHATPVVAATTARGRLQPSKQCATGFFADLSHLTPSTLHSMTVNVPSGVAAGSFLGVFFDGVETVTTAAVISQRV